MQRSAQDSCGRTCSSPTTQPQQRIQQCCGSHLQNTDRRNDRSNPATHDDASESRGGTSHKSHQNAVEQLEKQNPLSSLHGMRSRATAIVIPQASRTPGGHQCQEQQEQQNRRNQEDQEAASSHRPKGGQPQANQAPGPQPNRNNNNRGNNREEVVDSIMDAWDIINARRRAQLADNSDRFPALSSVFDNVDRKSTRLNSSHVSLSRMPSSA